MSETNCQIVLRSRPQGMVSESNFEQKASPRPVPGDDEALLRNLYLSIDPTIRGWIERDTYLPKIEIGAVIRSGGVAEVVESNTDAYKVGDRVFGMVGWQEYTTIGGNDDAQVIPEGIDPTDVLSIFGITGMTAYFGLLDIGAPREGETVVISGAAGAVGSVVGQIAKIKGCTVVGIAGSQSKCDWLTDELGFDVAINYKTEDVATRLREACPKGVNVYFDNVGGSTLDAVLAQIAIGARVVLCGAISQYNQIEDPYRLANSINLIPQRARMEGFIILDYMDRFLEGMMQLGTWIAEDKIKYRKTVVDGLDNSPKALLRLFSGEHDGKLMVKVA